MILRFLGALVPVVLLPWSCVAAEPPEQAVAYRLGSEVAVERHLPDDTEFRMPLLDLLAFGRKLFNANWTEQEGGGRPLVKGNGKTLSDPASPLTGGRSFNRISAPDANSCAGCHNAPYGISGGGGDFVTNVFVQAQRFDFASFDARDGIRTRGTLDEKMQPANLNTIGNMRATTGLFGAGYLEMLARQITADLQAIRDSISLGQERNLVSKGIHFGVIARRADGLWDASRVEGLPRASLISGGAHDPPSLIVRPWHQAGNVVSIREFTNTAMNQHHGIQTTERFGVDTDLDGDGFTNEMTRADVTALTLYQAALQVPGRVIPRDRRVEEAVLAGERLFQEIGCSACHVASLPLDRQGWMFSEPNPYNPAVNLRIGETETVRLDLSNEQLPQPRLRPGADGVVQVAAYTDFKLHDISDEGDPGAEPLDMNELPWSPKFRTGNQKFLTKRLWGSANEPPYFHHGLFVTMRQAVLAHSGEAKKSREAFQAAREDAQNAIIEFLKTLQVLPPGTSELIVDENYKARPWPPVARPEPAVRPQATATNR